MNITLLTEYSPYYSLLCLLLAVGYAGLLYTKEVPWPKWLNRLLFGLRAVLVFALLLLLLGPFVRQVQNKIEKPLLIFAVDNSASIPLALDSVQAVTALRNVEKLSAELASEDYETTVLSLNENTGNGFSNIAFNAQQTDLSALLSQAQSIHQHRNIAGVVLLTDGVFTSGSSPVYQPLRFPVYTLGIGDSVAQTDAQLNSVQANRISYLGNRFPMVVSLSHTGFAGQQANVQLLYKGKVIESKKIVLPTDGQQSELTFTAEAKEKGLQRYDIRLVPLQGEYTTANNRQVVYIDVLDGRQKVLLMAAAPHPDIKALRFALEQDKNVELVVHLAYAASAQQEKKLAEKFDLVILHQLPAQSRTGSAQLAKVIEKNPSVWYVKGLQSDFEQLIRQAQLVSFSGSRSQQDRVTPRFNSNFSLFNLTPEQQQAITKFPPLQVPFGDYNLLPLSQVVLYQQVGAVTTEKPLLLIGQENEQKKALLLGEGLWQWRMADYQRNSTTENFDALINKLVQYLSARQDKRRFRVYPSKEVHQQGEPVYVETEVYDQIYEPVYGQQVQLRLVNQQSEQVSNFSYVHAGPQFRFPLNGLAEGIYRYTASTTLNGKKQYSSGEFLVEQINREALNITADFALLQNLSAQTGGRFYPINQLDSLKQQLLRNPQPPIIHSQQAFTDVVGTTWLLVVLLLIAIVEWVVRKVKGGY